MRALPAHRRSSLPSNRTMGIQLGFIDGLGQPELRDQVSAEDPNLDHIEQAVLRAYVQLAVTPDETDGVRSVTLASFRAVEVRLTEIVQPKDDLRDIPSFWLEVCSHATGTVLDSCGCFEFTETELAIAADLVSEAEMRVG
ncbi:hypothetical protein ACD578_27085 (plasmid) [Microvirga sp. RSM25]|uniref:hypothetical protein n=1 Tax=Microvirga sp. RSM25 TaxID=3273802 RepID=UPI00384E238E